MEGELIDFVSHHAKIIIDFGTHHAKIIIDFATLLLGGAAFLRTMYVYRQQKHRDHELAEASDRLRRFEKFQDMQKRFREDKSIERVLEWLYPEQYNKPPTPITDVPEADRSNFMGFYEEIAIMINSRLISRDLAYWTIGLDAANFYDKARTYQYDRTWTLFNSFAEKVKARYPEITSEEIAKLNF